MRNFGYQIGQCRLYIYAEKTCDFYKELPQIKDNCQCGDCAYFEDVIVNMDIRFFRILKTVGVDLTRQPNINPDGLCSIGTTLKFKRSYIGYYMAFGKIGKTQRSTLTIGQGQKSVSFFENEEDSYTEFRIIQKSDEELVFEFFIQVERITNSSLTEGN